MNSVKTEKQQEIEAVLRLASDPVKAEGMKRFFRTGPGEYGEGDLFWGLPNPVVRKYVRQYKTIPVEDVFDLMQHPVHEIRLLALLIGVEKYAKADEALREVLVEGYLARTAWINNWDLVDLSAPGIVGEHLLTHPRDVLSVLANSGMLWNQRIAMVSTLTLIRANEFEDTLRLAAGFLQHPHDLMHKACGWMLREVGKRNRAILSEFLREYRAHMPRTMLRYAIEHYPEEERKAWLH